MQNEKTEGDRGNITSGSNCNIFTIPPRWYGHVERMPKHVATATTEGTRKDEDRLKQGEVMFRRT